MKKILIVVPSFNITNGVNSFLLNYLCNMDMNGLIIEVLGYKSRVVNAMENFSNLGCKVTLFPFSSKHLIKNKIFLKKLFKNNSYDVVHCNVMNVAKYVLYYAKKNGVKKRILHSHQTNYSTKKLAEFYYKLNIRKILSYSNCYLACSNLAGKFLFKNNNYELVYNAIDFNKYLNAEPLFSIQEKFQNKKIVGFVGRLSSQKNLFFLIKVFYNLCKTSNDYVLLLVGGGDLKFELEKSIEELSLSNKVFFIGEINNVYNYYKCFDVFVLPSLYEGLPVVGIEAQIAGCPCIFSETITKEVCISNETCFIGINNTENEWAEKIIEFSTKKNSLTENSKLYDIGNMSQKLKEIYEE